MIINSGRLGLAGQEENQLLLGPQWNRWLIPALFVLVAASVYLGVTTLQGVRPEKIASQFGVGIGIVGGIYTAYILIFVTKTSEERRRVLAIVPIILATGVAIMGLDQAGASFNLFAERFTDRGFFNQEIPAGSFQSVYPLTVILLAPLLAIFWTWLNVRKINFTATAKIGTGLVFMSLGFFVMHYAAIRAGSIGKVLPTWLILTYVLHTIGDLHIGPIIISAVTRIAPKGYVGSLLGLFGISLAFGHNAAGLVVGHLQMTDIGGMQSGFMTIFWVTLFTGIIVIAIAPLMAKLTRTDV